MENTPLLRNTANNNIFFELYEPYIKKEWKAFYFNYDILKAKYKALKSSSIAQIDVAKFDKCFYDEIRRVDHFLTSTICELEDDLSSMQNTQNKDHAVELFVRKLYDKSLKCENFFELNLYVVCKTSKKFEKVIDTLHKSDPNMVPMKHMSLDYINDVFSLRNDELRSITQRCIDIYSTKFRANYSALTLGELKFVKNKTKEHSKTKFYIGLKLGLVAMMVSLSGDFVL
jgi:hypothetical protein